MRNEKLIEAREQRGWTQEVASEKIGVSRVAYARWEGQGITPRLWAINQAREVFKMTPEQLGFRKYASNTSTSRHLIPPSAVRSPEIADASTAPALIRLGVSALTLAQHLYGYTIDELLLSIEQERKRTYHEQPENDGSPRR